MTTEGAPEAGRRPAHRSSGARERAPRRGRGPRIWPILLAVWLLTAAAIAGVLTVHASPAPTPDITAANDLVRTCEERWSALDAGTLDPATLPTSLDVTVVDRAGRVLATRGPVVANETSAYRARATAFDLSVAGHDVGTAYVADPAVADARNRHSLLVTTAVAGLGAVALAISTWIWWLRRRIVLPFRRLQGFARDVAAGRLDAPLAMDRSHLFGSFTESFDILRAELAKARESERVAWESKRTVVSQLGHDIRTPLSSITATAELLAVGEPDAARRDRLGVIVAKSRQIDALVEELFEANAEQLEALPVDPQPHPAALLAELLRRADVTGVVRGTGPAGRVELPDCLLLLDPARTQQVMDNVIGNAVKYAGTFVDVTAGLDGELLALTLRDHGPGVSPEDLPRLTGQRFRGANSAELPGLGLGLFTASWLMERMGGALTCHDAQGSGLAVVLEFRVA